MFRNFLFDAAAAQVAEHHRRVRKEAKKHPNRRKRLSADPGIPNTHPFKAQLMQKVSCSVTV
jgi:hypothetical protein